MTHAPTFSRRFILILSLALLAMFTSLIWHASADSALPKVDLNADNIGPRPIEALTSQVVARDYANAWLSMAEALNDNRAEQLDGYFTGWAKDNLSGLIAEQKRVGLHTKYIDHGHSLEASFYSPSGDVMQLRDQAKLEIQTLDGAKIIHEEQIVQQFIVLMTPGADRWLIRQLQAVPEAKR
jgi:hypothetical protein